MGHEVTGVKESKASDIRESVVLALEKQIEYEGTLCMLRQRLGNLESEQASADRDIESEILTLRTKISTLTNGLQVVKKIKAKAEAKLRRIETLEALDSKSALLVEVSARIGQFQVEAARLLQQAATLAADINQIAFDAIPKGSPHRARWGTGASVFPPGSQENMDSKVAQLEEAAAAVGDFVKNRMASLRTVVEMALQERAGNGSETAQSVNADDRPSFSTSVIGGSGDPPAELNVSFGR